MSTNSSPNLFRLSLPEWLKEQVDSGKHKGVYWIDRKEKIFHVPWKHASRNGWEDGDVSLFKAWAIYTNRYREGVDKARPALWKTNFRCAINSHNSIAFLKDQGQRKGDKAHRIMQLIDPPLKESCPLSNSNKIVEPVPPRRLVRLTYPNFGPPPPDGVPIERGRYRKAAEKAAKVKAAQKVEPSKKSCKQCNFIKIQIQDAVKIYDEIHSEEEENSDYQVIKTISSKLMTSNEHLCQNDELKNIMEKNLIATMNADADDDDDTASNNTEELPKPNLQDLYFIGKALQSADSNETLKVAIKVESEMEIVDTSYEPVETVETVETEVVDSSSTQETNKQEKNGTESENDDSFFEEKEQECEVEVQDAPAVEIIEQDPEDEELITPRN